MILLYIRNRYLYSNGKILPTHIYRFKYHYQYYRDVELEPASFVEAEAVKECHRFCFGHSYQMLKT